MHRILVYVIVCSILLCSLSGCKKQSADENKNSSTAEYQSYTVDDQGNILDTKTGEIIETTSPNNNIISPTNKPTTQTTVASNNTDLHIEPTPIPESLNWDSLYTEREWVFFTTEPNRHYFTSSDALMCRILIDSNLEEAIYVETYCLLENWQYPLRNDITVCTIDGQKYVQTLHFEYFGYLSSIIGSEDIVTLELKCYDGSGHNWLNDELKFKRTENNSFYLISGDYEEFGLKNGDVFVR